LITFAKQDYAQSPDAAECSASGGQWSGSIDQLIQRNWPTGCVRRRDERTQLQSWVNNPSCNNNRPAGVRLQSERCKTRLPQRQEGQWTSSLFSAGFVEST